MIRLFTVFCKLNEISFSDRQWFEQDVAGFRASSESCPHCGAKGCMDPFAHYDRYLIELKDGKPVIHCVEVPRYQCSSCGHTHALLSAALVPYRSYSLRFILHALRCYFLHQKTIPQICETYGIAPSTLYRWKGLFLRQKALWLGILSDLAEEPLSFLEGMDGHLLKGFFQAFQFSLLQFMPCTDREVPPGGAEQAGAPT